MSDRGSSRRGLLIVAVLLLLVFAAIDLTRADSVIAGAWNALMGQPRQVDRVEGVLERLPRRTR